MIYGFLSLKLVGLLVGLLLVGAHVFALLRGEEVRPWLTRFPRSRRAGEVLLTIDLVWAFWVVYTMDPGEFYYIQKPLLCLLPVFYGLTLYYVDEFLAVRALGIMALLAACPLLDAAFLKPPESRLLVVVLAYVWIGFGMLWVGQPHTLRDQIGWLNRSAARWQALAGAGVVYGVLILLCALVWY